MNVLTTICARKGSKRLPGKDIKMLRGKPLIMWTIGHAVRWGKGDIVVSSDNRKVPDMLPDGVTFLEKPDYLAVDNGIKMNDLRYTLIWAEKHFKKTYSFIVDLDITNPIRRVSDIENCYRLANNLFDYDSVFSVTNARRNPYFNQLEKRGGTFSISKDVKSWRSQDCPPVYDMNCCIYVYQRSFLVNQKNKHPVSNNSSIYLMPEYTFCDIDTDLDFKIVEMLMEAYGYVDGLGIPPF